MCGSKCRRDSASADVSGMNTPSRGINNEAIAAKDYSLHGLTSGFVNKQLDVVRNTMTCGILD